MLLAGDTTGWIYTFKLDVQCPRTCLTMQSCSHEQGRQKSFSLKVGVMMDWLFGGGGQHLSMDASQSLEAVLALE